MRTRSFASPDFSDFAIIGLVKLQKKTFNFINTKYSQQQSLSTILITAGSIPRPLGRKPAESQRVETRS
jgi:hypothetical protein